MSCTLRHSEAQLVADSAYPVTPINVTLLLQVSICGLSHGYSNIRNETEKHEKYNSRGSGRLLQGVQECSM